MKGRVVAAGFGGVVTSVAADLLNPDTPFGLYNMDTQDGQAKTRAGWANVSGAVGGFESSRGFDFVQGWNGGVSAEAYLHMVKRGGGGVRPYEVNPATGAHSEVLDGVSSLDLTDGQYVARVFNGEGLVIRRGGEVWRHTIGDLTHWKALDASQPADLTAPVAVAFDTTEAVGSATPGTPAGWTGATGANIGTITGSGVTVTHNSVVTDEWKLNISCGSGVAMTAKLQLVADKDWSGAGQLDFEFRWPKAYSKFANSVSLVLTNSVGTTVTMVCAHTLTLVGGTYVLAVTATFPSGYTPADWLVTRYITLGLTGGASGSGNVYTLSAVTPSSVSSSGGEPSLAVDDVTYRVRFGLSSYDSERDVESENVMASGWFRMLPAQRYFDDVANDFIGNVPVVTAQHSGESMVTHCRVYVQFEDDMVWRLVEPVPLADVESRIDLPYLTMALLPPRIAHEPTPVGAPVCFETYKGFVAWGYDQAQGNVAYSAVGQPGRLARDTDTDTDLERGRTTSMADALDDSPRELVGAGDVLFGFGRRGVYAAFGETPSGMSVMRHVPKTRGVLGQAACRYMDDDGVPGVVWVGTDQEIWLIKSVAGVREDFGFPVQMLSADVTGLVRSFLTQTDTPDETLLSVGVDEIGEALWVVYGGRALVLRKRGVAGDRRGWHPHGYAGGSWSKWDFGVHGIRAVRTTGQIDQFERVGLSPVTGVNRDGGSAMPEAYMDVTLSVGVPLRVFSMDAFRPGDASFRLRVTSDEGMGTYSVATGKKHCRFGIAQQGKRHVARVLLGESEGPVTEMVFETHTRGARRDG